MCRVHEGKRRFSHIFVSNTTNSSSELRQGKAEGSATRDELRWHEVRHGVTELLLQLALCQSARRNAD